VATPEVIDQIHELILEDRRISAKSIAGQLGISRERVGSIIQENLDMRKRSAKWVPKCLNADQKRQRCQSSEQLLEFFRRDPNDFLSRLVTMDEMQNMALRWWVDSDRGRAKHTKYGTALVGGHR
jgi:histone-lysine N-methyltransferase SETMAR